MSARVVYLLKERTLLEEKCMYGRFNNPKECTNQNSDLYQSTTGLDDVFHAFFLRPAPLWNVGNSSACAEITCVSRQTGLTDTGHVVKTQ